MQITETLSTGLKREFRVVVPAADLDRELDSKLKELAGRAQIKGFRPGKVPVPHLRRIYGKSVMADVVQETIESSNKQLLQERSLKPAYQPQVTLPEDRAEVEKVMDGKGDLAFSVVFEVVPSFEIQDPSGIELTRHVVAIEDSHVDETLARLARGYRTYEPRPEGEPAQASDEVTISFVGKIDGQPFENGSGEDVPLTLGTGQFLPGFEDQLIGAKAGEERIVNVTFPENYGVPTLAGKPAEFEVRVTRVAAPTEPALDDEFAKKVGLESLDALRNALRQQLSREFGEMTAMKLKRDVLDALDKTYSFELPQRLVDAEFEGIWRALESEMSRAKKSFADEGTSEEDARKEYRAIAERRVRLGLVLGTLGDREGITVTDEELQNALMRRASQFRERAREVIDYYRKNPGALIELRGPIFEQKVVDWIVSKAKVTDHNVSRDELQALVKDEEEEDGELHDHDHGSEHDHSHHDHAHHHHDDGDHSHDHDHADHEHRPVSGTAE